MPSRAGGPALSSVGMAGDDGNGWAFCDLGHRHWGIYGAAGLLTYARDRTGQRCVLLVRRASWTQHGGTWGPPGGARDSHESAVEAALREAAEECGLPPGAVRIQGLLRDDHGGWSYETVVAGAPSVFPVLAASREATEVGWVPVGSVDSLPVEAGEVGLNGWIKIAADGTVLLAMNRSEMGQGTHTALAMLVAEELDVPLARVRLVTAGAHGGPNVTIDFSHLYHQQITIKGQPGYHPPDRDKCFAVAAEGKIKAQIEKILPLARAPEAHRLIESGEITGKIVSHAAANEKPLHRLSLAEMQGIDKRIPQDALSVLSVARSVASRTSYGGTAPKNVRAAARKWLKRLGK